VANSDVRYVSLQPANCIQSRWRIHGNCCRREATRKLTDIASELNEAFAGHYSIEREIGRGGMATVYLAQDLRHGRPVAIKVLHSELGEAIGADRFLREIQVIARLRHPHIVPLYDSGETGGRLYYVMPFVKGDSVRGRIMKSGAFHTDDALRLTSEVADALEYAHGEGVVHRDIKPDNIMLDERHALVMDFGIARALSEGTDASLTKTGFLVGTPAYMSPEQVTGEGNIDGRSDIYSLGCVLYEMLAGKAPFTGPSANAVMAKRFSAPKPSLDPIEQPISVAVANVLTTAMSLSRDERFQTARGMADAIDAARTSESPQFTPDSQEIPNPSTRSTVAQTRGGGRRLLFPAIGALVLAAVVFGVLALKKEASPSVDVSGPRSASIGVLAFRNQGGDKKLEYFSEGLTDELISALSHVPGLQVAGRASSYAIKNQNLDARASAERLQVAYVVDAGVRSDGSHVRVTWQLVDGKTGKGLGSGDIDGEMRDVITLQDSMAKKIVEGLSSVIGSVSPATMPRHQTANYEAHDLYLKGHFFWNQRTAATMKQGISYLKQAIEKDSSYALAWAELSSAYTLEPTFGDMAPAEALPRAREAARKALQLDPTLSESNTAMGMSLSFNDWDPKAGLVYLDKAIALDPQNSFPRLFRVWPLLMLGRSNEALEELRKARMLDPLSAIINTRVGSVLIFMGRSEDAVTELRKALVVDPSNLLARFDLGKALAATGHYDEAFRQFPDAIDAEAGITTAYVAWAYGRAGRPDAARGLFNRLYARSKERYMSPLALAASAAASNQQQPALDFLEEGLRDHSFFLVFLRTDPIYERLRSEPRYIKVLAEVEKKYAKQ
jgi:serine/threonine protein kinase/tetratricopeptide (TPR) repeat protein